MARITVEDCLNEEGNRFALVRLASHRAKQLLAGSVPVTNTRGNRAIVSALREIAAGKVRFTKDEVPIETDCLDSTLSALGISTKADSVPVGESAPASNE